MLVAILAGFAVAVVAPWLAQYVGRFAGWVIALLPVSLVVYLAGFLPDIADGQTVVESTRWFPSLGISLSFLLDGLSLTFALLISGIGALVMIYTGGYLQERRDIGRFFAFILAFMASMLGVVLANNLITLFVFWELTSLTSYFLIGFDNEKKESRAAALQALLVTGLGGLVLLAGLLLLGQVGGSLELSELLANPEVIRDSSLYLPILLLVLVGAFTKSAQVPFHFWLPNAMAAPTPASAYLHSSTMVKAGVYLLARMHPILGGTEAWFGWLTAFGAVTMLAGAFFALRETYFKRVLAYTTVSALGALTLLLGIGTKLSIKAAMTFLITHAFYKAALFLVAGAVDHATHQRDVEKLGGLARKMPVTATAAVLAALSMAGVIPLIGFLSKELLFEAALDAPSLNLLLTLVVLIASIWIVAAAAIGCIKPFFGSSAHTPQHAHEAPLSLWIGPVLLALSGLAVGLAPQWLAGPLVAAASSAVLGTATQVKLALWHGLTWSLALDWIAILGGVAFYLWRSPVRQFIARFETLLKHGPARWYEWGLNGLNAVAAWQTRTIQSGYLRFYLMTIVLTAVGLVGYVLVVRGGGFPSSIKTSDWRFHEVGLAVIVLLAAGAVVFARSRLGAIAAMGVVGYGVGLLFVLFGAPDLAITQFVIETLTVILFVLVFYHLKRFKEFSRRRSRARDAVIALAAGALMTVLVLIASLTQWHQSISTYFVENSYTAAHGRNVVNVILVDFRGIDTLGEITVLAVAGIGVYALLKLRLDKSKKERVT